MIEATRCLVHRLGDHDYAKVTWPLEGGDERWVLVGGSFGEAVMEMLLLLKIDGADVSGSEISYERV